MGSELLVNSFPGTEAVDESSIAFSFNQQKTFTDIFEEHFPYYILTGMSYEEYWEMDCRLVIFYRKAEEEKKKTENYNMWLQGLYVYDAILRASPILHAFASKGTKPVDYPSKPYSINEQERKKDEEEKGKAFVNKGLDYMKALMTQQEVKDE